MGAPTPLKLKEILLADPSILSGRAVFRGTKISVASLFAHLEKGLALDDFLKTHPAVLREQAVGVLEHSSDWIETEIAQKKHKPLLGCMEGSVEFPGDIVKSIELEWDAQR